MLKLIITGDVNFMNVADARGPFRRVKETFLSADLVFCNLECCLTSNFNEGSTHVEGFFADPEIVAAALTECRIGAVGVANNVNYGADAITESMAHLEKSASLIREPARPTCVRARPPWLELANTGSRFCREAPSIGRQTMKRRRIRQGSLSSVDIRRTKCRCTR